MAERKMPQERSRSQKGEDGSCGRARITERPSVGAGPRRGGCCRNNAGNHIFKSKRVQKRKGKLGENQCWGASGACLGKKHLGKKFFRGEERGFTRSGRKSNHLFPKMKNDMQVPGRPTKRKDRSASLGALGYLFRRRFGVRGTVL